MLRPLRLPSTWPTSLLPRLQQILPCQLHLHRLPLSSSRRDAPRPPTLVNDTHTFAIGTEEVEHGGSKRDGLGMELRLGLQVPSLREGDPKSVKLEERQVEGVYDEMTEVIESYC